MQNAALMHREDSKSLGKNGDSVRGADIMYNSTLPSQKAVAAYFFK